MEALGFLITGFLWMGLAAVIGMKLPRLFNINPWWSVLLVPLMLILAICILVIADSPGSHWGGLELIFINLAVLGGWLYLSVRIALINTGRVIAKRMAAMLCLWMPLTLASGNMFLTEAGVCVSEMRRFSDDELIEAVVPDLKLLRDNPRCCSVNRGWMNSSEFLIGRTVVHVEINLERDPETIRPGERYIYHKRWVAIDVCGKYLGGEGTGTFTETLETTDHIYHPKGEKP